MLFYQFEPQIINADVYQGGTGVECHSKVGIHCGEIDGLVGSAAIIITEIGDWNGNGYPAVGFKGARFGPWRPAIPVITFRAFETDPQLAAGHGIKNVDIKFEHIFGNIFTDPVGREVVLPVSPE